MNKAKATKFRRASTKNDILLKQHIRDSLREDGDEEGSRDPILHFVDVVELSGTSNGKVQLNADEKEKIFGHDEVHERILTH